ncbi:MAG: ZIP family metal transporter [Candidatus Thermoplasmatota archaeon]
MNRVTLLLAALLLATTGAAAQTSSATAPLYLQSDGSLSLAVGAASACLTIGATTSASVTETFAGTFTNQTVGLPAQAVAVSVAFAQGANAGTGFTLAGELRLGAAVVLSDAVAYGSGAAVSSPAALVFDVGDLQNATGDVQLALKLSKTGTGLAMAGQSVSVQCGNLDSKLHSFTITQSDPQGVVPEPEEPASGEGPGIPAILGIALLAGAITLAAGAVVLAGRTISQRRIHFLLGATAGLLLAIAMLDLVPEALELSPEAPYTIVLALLVLFLVRHFFAGEHNHSGSGHGSHGHGASEHDQHGRERVASHAGGLAILAFFALGFHRFVDGLILPAAFELDNAVGLAAAGAVLIHQFPDGIAAASLFLAAGWKRSRVLLGIAVMAALTPVGSLLGLTIIEEGALVGHLIALAAATFIFIALAELLPELRAREQRAPVGIGFGVGYVVAFLIVFIPSLFGIHV